MTTLLLVDDDIYTREGIFEMFSWESLGIERVEQAEDGVGALELAERIRPDILLTDVRMPRMDGIELAFRVRELFPQCIIIIMSAYSDKEYLKSAIKVSAIQYVEKPIDETELKDAIQKAVTLHQEEKRRLQEADETKQKLTASLPVVKMDVALKLIRKSASPEAIGSYLGIAAPHIGMDCEYVTLLIRIPGAVDKGSEIDPGMQQWTFEAVEQLLHQKGATVLAGIAERYIIVHVCLNPENAVPLKVEHIRDLCGEMAEAVGMKGKTLVSVGKPAMGILNLYESYNTAVLNLQKAFYHDARTVYLWDEKELPDFTFDEEILSRFSQLISDNDKDQYIQLLCGLTGDFRRHASLPVNCVKDIYSRMLLQIYKQAKERRVDIFDGETDQEAIRESVHALQALTEIEELVRSKAEAYFGLIAERGRNSVVVTEIIRYVQENYSHEKLSLNDIARHIHLSPAYICVVFKEETGKTVNQYIAEYRLEKAKELLRDSRHKIKDISSRVGYSDGNYFAKIFRKMTGLTPVEFREQAL